MLMRAGVRFQRGQVMPMWILGTIASLALAFLMLDYGNNVRWQIRAQNAADATAQGMIAAQADQFNKMESLLYAANVEEYRIRFLLDGMLLAINKSGACTTTSLTSTTAQACNRIYSDLKNQFTNATGRYTADILMLDTVTGLTNQTNVLATAQYGMSANQYWCSQPHVTAGTAADGGDCGVRYSLDAYKWRTDALAVNHDAVTSVVPGLGRYDATYGANTENATFFAPLSVDVVACATVQPLIPSFGPFKWPVYHAIGRAAATAVQVEQDFMQPGDVCDPAHAGTCGWSSSAVFQPPEDYTPTTIDYTAGSWGNGVNWYEVWYGGNLMTAVPSIPAFQGQVGGGYGAQFGDEMSVMMGWWGSVPIRPFGPAIVLANAC